MREFACKSLGYTCNWHHIARTEELLADVVAVHLRDVHGMKALSMEMLGKIKNAFSNPDPLEAKQAEGLVMKEYNCKDLGYTCNFRYIAQTEELIADGVAVHMRETHGIKEFTPELKAKVSKSLRPWT